jgi:hypothetical protein
MAVTVATNSKMLDCLVLHLVIYVCRTHRKRIFVSDRRGGLVGRTQVPAFFDVVKNARVLFLWVAYTLKRARLSHAMALLAYQPYSMRRRQGLVFALDPDVRWE